MSYTFTIDQKHLLSTLAAMQPICTKRTTLDTTSCILFQIGHKELVLKSTDLEISLQANCTADMPSNAFGESFLVSGKRIFELVKELEGPIDITCANNSVSVHAGSVQVALNIKEAEGFPSFPERIENLMQLDTAQLLSLLDKVAFLIPQNNANPALNGLYLEVGPAGLSMTTTDGHCLARVQTELYTLAEEKKWLIPRRAIFEIKKIVEYTESPTLFLGLCGNQLVFSGSSFNFFTKLLHDQFPQYATILSKESFLPARLDRSLLIKTLKRSACLLSGQFIATRFSFENNQLHVALQNNEVGTLQEVLPVEEFEGAPLAIRFYAPYLLNGLHAFGDDKVLCYLKNPSRPIIFESATTDALVTYLVMPVSPTTR